MTKLTNRDMAIFRALAACQILETSQLHRWHFKGLSLAAAHKRLGKLTATGYLRVVETKIGMDNVYVLDRNGAEALKKDGWKWEIKKEIPKDLDHHLGVVDARIAIEQGLERTSGMKLRYFYAYWELGQFGWPYPIIPDAVFSIRNAFTAQAALEFDRNQYALTVFAKKLMEYRHLIRCHPITTVIIVAEKVSQIEKLGKGLEEVGSVIPIISVPLEELRLHGLKATPYRGTNRLEARTITDEMEMETLRRGLPNG